MEKENKRKSTIKLAIVLSILLVVVIGFGVTFAFFSDIVDPNETTLRSAKLDLDVVTPIGLTCKSDFTLNVGDAANAPFDTTEPILPGDTFAMLGEVKNTGNVEMAVRIIITNTEATGHSMWQINDKAIAGFTVNTTDPLKTLIETTLVPNGTIDLKTLVDLEYLYGDNSAINDNSVQDTPYHCIVKIEAIQKRNSTLPAKWADIVTTEFDLP